jgi:hypothetical protein
MIFMGTVKITPHKPLAGFMPPVLPKNIWRFNAGSGIRQKF